MGITYIKGTVTGPRDKQKEIQFLVDSGAGYTLLPEKIWKAIGLTRLSPQPQGYQ